VARMISGGPYRGSPRRHAAELLAGRA
jgi:hypothetical protein